MAPGLIGCIGHISHMSLAVKDLKKAEVFMKKLGVIIILVFCLGAGLLAEGDYGAPGEFLSWGAGARSMGLGRAFTGLADDPSAVIYNPAGLAQQNPLQISLQHVILFYDTMYDFAAVTYPLSGIGTFAGSYIRLGSTGFDSRDSQWATTGSFGVTSQAFLISYARDITGWLASGVNLKLISESVYDRSAMGYGADLGLMFKPHEMINIGLALINAIPASIKLNETAESFPIVFKFGLAFKFLGERVIPVLDFEKSFSNKDFKFRLGLEAYPIQDLALRVGLDETELTFGAGYFIKPVRIDYSLSSQELGLTHRASITLAFGGFDINLKAEPSIFSPVGIRKTTTVSIYAVTKYPINEWELNIINEDGDAVRTYSGDDNPPATVIWNGKDDRGLPVQDGEYKLVMKIKDKNGRTIESGKETVRVSSSIPLQPGALKLEE